jgi:hypothetical protein
MIHDEECAAQRHARTRHVLSGRILKYVMGEIINVKAMYLPMRIS